jgi:hypothetical protein
MKKIVLVFFVLMSVLSTTVFAAVKEVEWHDDLTEYTDAVSCAKILSDGDLLFGVKAISTRESWKTSISGRWLLLSAKSEGISFLKHATPKLNIVKDGAVAEVPLRLESGRDKLLTASVDEKLLKLLEGADKVELVISTKAQDGNEVVSTIVLSKEIIADWLHVFSNK